MENLLSDNSPFADCLQGFCARPQQQRMAEQVEYALTHNKTLVIEAGTGVGKTLAYLVPAILSGKKVIVSTGTKHLQDQLYHKDLPLVQTALGVTHRTALLKGRANYLCLHRLQMSFDQGAALKNSDLLHKVREWAGLTKTGEISELTAVPEAGPIWSMVTSTADNCLGLECPDYQDCHVIKARRAAQEADLVVINHHLLFADLAIRDEGYGELLPTADAFILDEAHQLHEVAVNFFGATFSARQCQELSRDTIAEQLADAPEMSELRTLTEKLEQSVLDLRLAMGRPNQRGVWSVLRHKPDVGQAFQRLGDALQALKEGLALAAERGKGLKNCYQRAIQLFSRFSLLLAHDPDNTVQWFETFRRSFVLHSTPLEIGEIFNNSIKQYKSTWIFTSATLAVGGRFDHFINRLGLLDADSHCLDSPYDYENNAMLYLPEGLPDTRDGEYTQAVIDAALPVIEASGGRTFLLFTSHQALQAAAHIIEDKIDYPLMVQGRAPRHELLDRFRDAGNAVLLGTSSFWEGVDVRGSALSCVVIDKLPFASPGDPVTRARLDAMRAKGINPFTEYQVPQAVITLKQGVGRLIRDHNDTGVLMICDPRLKTRPYGKVFLNSLPPMPVTSELRMVKMFLHSLANAP